MNPAPFVLVLMASVFVLCCGCQKPAADSDPKTAKSQHEHFPDHWPRTVFVAAERLHTMMEANDLKSSNESISVEKEWTDLIRWLPELVADSELSERDFHAIDAWSTRASKVIEERFAKRAPFEELKRIDGLAENIADLLKVCRAEQSRIDSQ